MLTMGWKMTRPSKRKRSQRRKAKHKRTRPRLNENTDSKLIGKSRLGPLSMLANARDNLVIEKLSTAAFDELFVDRLALNPQQPIGELRAALIKVYLKAAQARQLSKATKSQLATAKSALSQLTRALVNLEKVSTDGRNGLRMLLEGSPLDDEKGERELNELASACWQIRLDIAPIGLALRLAIEAEENKQSTVGERRKRLRTQVDALADWWQSKGGSLAPSVKANRRDGGAPAVVHGRHGHFLELAVALFCKVDVFKASEVEAAVTNVHEKRLAPTTARTRD